MTESNTGSDQGPNTPKGPGETHSLKSFKHGEKRILGPSETPREKMLRVIKTVKKRHRGSK